jgi:hypothetical protein
MSTGSTERLEKENKPAAPSKVAAVVESGAAKPATGSEQPRAEQPQIKIDDTRVQGCYANFCRVTGTPEELVIDFALNPQPYGAPVEPVVINQRLVTNFYTAKRLWQALGMTLQRHEAAFGVLETNVQKRVQTRPS